MRESTRALLEAMRADGIPPGRSGLWAVKKAALVHEREGYPGREPVPPGLYTSLMRVTACSPTGYSVMCDDPVELSRHLEGVISARGRVLVTGLGLGCVLRGLLCNPRVAHVDVLERSAHVMKLVEPYLPRSERYTIHVAEAEGWLRANRGRRWDYAWHDVWTDESGGEEHLSVKHAKLMSLVRGRVGAQGAWALPRWLRRSLAARGI